MNNSEFGNHFNPIVKAILTKITSINDVSDEGPLDQRILELAAQLQQHRHRVVNRK